MSIPKLRSYQRVGVKRLVADRRLALLDDVGLGKTVQSLSACRELGLESVLVLTTTSMASVWLDELATWWPEAEGSVAIGTYRQRDRAWQRDATVYIAPFSSYVADADEIRRNWDAVILDEAHHLRNRRRSLFRACRPLARQSDCLFELTATPLVTDPVNLWPLLNLLDHQEFKSYWSFVKRHCPMKFNGFAWIPSGEVYDHDVLAQHIGPYVLRRTQDEVQKELPRLTEQTTWVELSRKDQQRYDQLRDELWLELDSGDLSADTVGATTTRLRILTYGSGLLERPPKYGSSHKLSVLVDDILRRDEPVVAFSNFHAVLDGIAHLLGNRRSVARVDARITGRRRGEEIRRFQAGEADVMLASPKAGGEGVSYTVSRVAVAGDKHWTPDRQKQAVGRLRRTGQTRPVVANYVLARKTIDEHIDEILADRTASWRSLERSLRLYRRLLGR